MIATVSTVKDTLANVQRFVAGNLAGGVDHMVIFLDAPDAEVEAWLATQSHVSTVVADQEWWGRGRPADLNTRQRDHANIVRSLLTVVPGVDWIFHVDADEIVQVDRSVIDGLGGGVRNVRLQPLEAVSQMHWDGDPTWFKRLLGPEDLHLLEVLGVVSRPSNGVHFHGHVEGKVGMRPALDAWLTLHRIVDADREPLDTFEDDRLRMLHYESYSGEDFVRKWSTMLAAGPMPNFRKARQTTADAVRVLLDKPLDQDVRERYLAEIFRRTTEDDLVTLRDLGLLEQVDPRNGTHRPTPLPDKEALDAMLGALRGVDKKAFRVCGPAKEVEPVLKAISSKKSRFRFGR